MGEASSEGDRKRERKVGERGREGDGGGREHSAREDFSFSIQFL